MNNERLLNVPNCLSIYRIAITPFVLYLVYLRREDLFLLFLCINVVTDILDGLIARAFHLQTKIGARLDSAGDVGTYILAAAGLLKFRWQSLSGEWPVLTIFLIFFLLPYIVSYLRFRKLPSLHLYSSKIGGTIDVVFVFLLFFVGYQRWVLHLAVAWGVLSFIEQTVILMLLRDLRSDCRGLYWVLRN